MDLRVEGRAKDFSLTDASAPIMVRGTFADPKVRIGGLDLLPFFELGETRDVDCSGLLNPAP